MNTHLVSRKLKNVKNWTKAKNLTSINSAVKINEKSKLRDILNT